MAGRAIEQRPGRRRLDQAEAARRHSPFDDAQALLAGTLFVASGLLLFRQAGLMTGGTAGIARLVHYASGWPFGALFFLANLPPRR